MRCEWCLKEVESTQVCMNTGKEYMICNDCFKNDSGGICICCGQTIGVQSIKGMCLDCAVEISNKVKKKREEVAMGVNREVAALYSSKVELSDKDYEAWLTLLQPTYTAEMRKKARLNWVKTRLLTDWDADIVEDNIQDIAEIMDRNFSKLINKQCRLIYLDGNKAKGGFGSVECLDIQNRILLV